MDMENNHEAWDIWDRSEENTEMESDLCGNIFACKAELRAHEKVEHKEVALSSSDLPPSPTTQTPHAEHSHFSTPSASPPPPAHSSDKVEDNAEKFKAMLEEHFAALSKSMEKGAKDFSDAVDSLSKRISDI